MGPNILLALALCFLSLSLLTSAAPAIAYEEKKSPSHINDITVMGIAHATGNKCRGAPLPDQCRDASQVAKILSAVFHTYHIITPGEKAALISLMAYETGDFMYNTAVNGIPGKGSRELQILFLR